MFVLDRSSSDVHALDAWREAERLVFGRWGLFADAGPEARQFAFASYVAALDSEEAGAAELALTADPRALSADRLAA